MFSRPGETQVYSLARQQWGILINLLLKAQDALKIRRYLSLNPSRFEFLLNFSFNLPPEYLPSDCLSISLSRYLCLACLPASLLAYPPVCLPMCLSTCIPVSCSSLDKTPACHCLMKPTTRETWSTGGKKKAEKEREERGGGRY